MPLLSSCFIDFLAPKDDNIPYYNSFLSQYTLITVTALVSQLNLIPEMYEDMSKETLDNDVDGMIKEFSKGAKNKRDTYEMYCLAAHIAPGLQVQRNEKRVFLSEVFSKEAEKYNLSSREMVIRGLNSSAFLNYFFLIENTLKNIYLQKCNPPSNFFVKGSEIIDVCLVKILNKINKKDKFSSTLLERSKFFIDIKSLSNMWSILNFIRNKIAHSNGYYDEKSIRSFKRRLDTIIKYYADEDDMILSISMLADNFEEYKTQIETKGYLIVDDVLENIIRNFSIFIMESLYISEQQKI